MILKKLRNRWEARRRVREQKEAEELAAEVRGEFHTLREHKSAVRGNRRFFRPLR